MQSTPVIVLVAADPVTRNRVGECLRRQGWVVVAAANGYQALATLEARAVSLVLCDLELPGLSGTGVLAAMRAREADGRRDPTPFVLMAETRPAQLLASDGYLPKPVETAQLLALIQAELAAPRAA